MEISNYISSGIIEMYVLGLCSPEEKTELEMLRLQYPQLNEAIINFENEFEKKALLSQSETSKKLDDTILQSFKELNTPVINLAAPKQKNSIKSWLKPMAAAAVLMFITSSIFNYTLLKKVKEQQAALNTIKNQSASLPESDYKILKNPRITPVAMYGVGTHAICRCTLFWDKKTGKAYMMIHHLVPSSNEKQYQVWAMVNDKPVNVGMINDAIRDRFIEIRDVPEGATAFSVTLENKGGSLIPTTEETYLFGKI